MRVVLPDEQIRAFLKGQGSPEERAAIAEQLAADAQLARRAAQLRVEIAVSELLIAEDTRKLLQRWRAQKRQSTAPNMRFLLVAAALASLIGMAGIIWYLAIRTDPAPLPPAELNDRSVLPQASEPPKRQVAPSPMASSRPAEYYRRRAARLLPDPPLPTFRNTLTAVPDDPVVRAQQAYTEGHYGEALALLERADSSRSQTAAFWAAHALFRLGRYGEAAERFSNLIAQRSRQYRYAAEWGLLLCRYAELPKQALAFQQQLRAILAQPDHPYFDVAQELAQDK